MRSVRFSAIAMVLIMVASRIGWGADQDLQDLEGTWRHMPKCEPDTFKVTRKGEYKGEYEVKFTNLVKEQGSITWDPKAIPKTIDLTISSGPDKGKIRKGIYELKGLNKGHVVAP
jgi:uncharacterized protein (TIGR03067 family)